MITVSEPEEFILRANEITILVSLSETVSEKLSIMFFELGCIYSKASKGVYDQNPIFHHKA